MAGQWDISPSWTSSVRDVNTGAVPAADASLISNTYSAWQSFSNYLKANEESGSAYSTQVISTFSLVYSSDGTASKFEGGVLNGRDEIHFVPHSAIVGQKVNVTTDTVTTYSLIYTTANAYSGGVMLNNEEIHFVPHNAIVGQKVDKNGTVSTYSLVYTTAGAYKGGVLSANGEIIFVPSNAAVGQKVSAAGVVSTFSLLYTGSSGVYCAGVLAPDGSVHFIPARSTAPGQKISSTGVVSTYTVVGRDYSGGLLDSDGNIVCIPASQGGTANTLQKINPFTGVCSTFTILSHTNSSYLGGVRAINGDIYFITQNPNNVDGSFQKINVNGTPSTFTVRSIDTGEVWRGGVLAPNGDIYLVPSRSLRGQKISTFPGRQPTYANAKSIFNPNGF